jgi:hypothetical protein
MLKVKNWSTQADRQTTLSRIVLAGPRGCLSRSPLFLGKHIWVGLPGRNGRVNNRPTLADGQTTLSLIMLAGPPRLSFK